MYTKSDLNRVLEGYKGVLSSNKGFFRTPSTVCQLLKKELYVKLHSVYTIV